MERRSNKKRTVLTTGGSEIPESVVNGRPEKTSFNPIQDGFLGLLTDWGQKGFPSLESVSHVLQ